MAFLSVSFTERSDYTASHDWRPCPQCGQSSEQGISSSGLTAIDTLRRMRTVLIRNQFYFMRTEPEMPPNPNAPTLVVVPVQPSLPPRLNSRQLFRDGKTVEIDHGEQRYTLRVTRDNKLILTK
jgi:hemin uptake protein HemP